MAAKPTPAKQFASVVDGILRRCGTRFVSRMQREHTSGPTGPTSLSVRTGALRRSFFFNTTSTGKTARLDVYGGMFAPYARIHEEGGWITPKKAKHLAIPLQAAKTAAGVSRWTSPRNFPGELTFIKSKLGNKLLVKFVGRGKRKRMIPMFVLKDSVFIPPRLNFGRTFEQESERALSELAIAAEFLKVDMKTKSEDNESPQVEGL